jgi:hypothetical protein
MLAKRQQPEQQRAPTAVPHTVRDRCPAHGGFFAEQAPSAYAGAQYEINSSTDAPVYD